MNFDKLRYLSNVRRFNQHHCSQYQNVAEHSFFVALLCHEAMSQAGGKQWYFPDLHLAVLEAALLHDAHEAATGDIPYLVKREIFGIDSVESKANRELGIERVILKTYRSMSDLIVSFFDKYELKLYLETEVRQGNGTLVTIEAETYTQLKQHMVHEIDRSFFMDWVHRLQPCRETQLPEDMVHG